MDAGAFSDEKVAEKSKSFVTIRINGDQAEKSVRENREDASDAAEAVEAMHETYKVRRYPTVLFLDKDGKELDRLVGGGPPAKLLELMDAVLAKVPAAKPKGEAKEPPKEKPTEAPIRDVVR